MTILISSPSDTKGYFPDADVVIIEDSNGTQAKRYFSVETRAEITDDKVWTALRAAMEKINQKGGKKCVYDVIYQHKHTELDAKGPAHAILKAALCEE